MSWVPSRGSGHSLLCGLTIYTRSRACEDQVSAFTAGQGRKDGGLGLVGRRRCDCGTGSAGGGGGPVCQLSVVVARLWPEDALRGREREESEREGERGWPRRTSSA